MKKRDIGQMGSRVLALYMIVLAVIHTARFVPSMISQGFDRYNGWSIVMIGLELGFGLLIWMFSDSLGAKLASGDDNPEAAITRLSRSDVVLAAIVAIGAYWAVFGVSGLVRYVVGAVMVGSISGSRIMTSDLRTLVDSLTQLVLGGVLLFRCREISSFIARTRQEN